MNWKDIKNLIKEELKTPSKLITETSKKCKYRCKNGVVVPGNACSDGSCCEGNRKKVCGDKEVGLPRGGKVKSKKGKKQVAEAEVTAGDSKFNLRTGVNKNPTKLGIKIQFEPKGEFLSPDVKNKLEVALQEKLNKALLQYNIQVSKDTDVPRKHVIGFFIPISQLKNLIVKALGGTSLDTEIPKGTTSTTPPPQTPPSPPKLSGEEEEMAEMITQELLNEALRVRDLNEISKVVYKEDFYGFINAGQNVMRTLEENGFEPKLAKKYLEHLVKNNIL